MRNLKVHIDAHSGFCFGVVYAIEMAEDILNEEGICGATSTPMWLMEQVKDRILSY